METSQTQVGMHQQKSKKTMELSVNKPIPDGDSSRKDRKTVETME